MLKGEYKHSWCFSFVYWHFSLCTVILFNLKLTGETPLALLVLFKKQKCEPAGCRQVNRAHLKSSGFNCNFIRAHLVLLIVYFYFWQEE